MPKRPAAAPPAVSILYGRRGREDLFDDFLASEHLSAIKSALGGDSAISSAEYDAADADLADVLDEVRTPALFGAARLVILRGAQAILAPAAADRSPLAPLLTRMEELAARPAKSGAGRLVLIAKALEIREGTPKTAFPEAQRLIAAVAEAGGLRSCVPPYERELKAILARSALDRGARLLPAAAEALVAIVGTERMALEEELEKLVAGAREAGVITPEDVEALAAERPERNVFALAEKILDRDCEGALSLARSLFETPATRSSAYILASIAATFRRYLLMALEIEAGAGAREAARAVPPAYQRDCLRRLERWPARALEGLLRRALQCDVEVKTGSVAEEIAIETFVMDACAGRVQTGDLAGRWIHEI